MSVATDPDLILVLAPYLPGDLSGVGAAAGRPADGSWVDDYGVPLALFCCDDPAVAGAVQRAVAASGYKTEVMVVLM